MAEKNFMKNEEDDARKWRLSGVKWTDQADSLQPKPSPGIIPPSLCCSWKKMLLVELLCVTCDCAVHWSALSFIYKDTETEMWRVVLISNVHFFLFHILWTGNKIWHMESLSGSCFRRSHAQKSVWFLSTKDSFFHGYICEFRTGGHPLLRRLPLWYNVYGMPCGPLGQHFLG